jgi:hypothetical protein
MKAESPKDDSPGQSACRAEAGEGGSASDALVSRQQNQPSPVGAAETRSIGVQFRTDGNAAANFKGLMRGTLSPKEIVTLVVGCAVLTGFLFLDWRALLQRKKFAFNFRIWK